MLCEIESGWECTAPTAATPIPDYSFEEGGAWTATSTHFDSPVCDEGSCGLGTGTGPSHGAFWVWFGGIADEAMSEEARMTQSIVIPSSATVLTFDLEIPVCDSASDYMELRIDGNVEFSVAGDSAACGQLGYQVQQVDISAYADDASHELQFFSETFSEVEPVTNIFVDRVEMPGQASMCTETDPSLLFMDGFED